MKSTIKPCLHIKELWEKKIDFVQELEEKRNAWPKIIPLLICLWSFVPYFEREICFPCNDSLTNVGPWAVLSL